MPYADKKQVPLFLERSQIDLLDKYAKKIGVSRQQLMFNVISGGLTDLGIMNKTGALFIGVNVRDFLLKFKDMEIEDQPPNNLQRQR